MWEPCASFDKEGEGGLRVSLTIPQELTECLKIFEKKKTIFMIQQRKVQLQIIANHKMWCPQSTCDHKHDTPNVAKVRKCKYQKTTECLNVLQPEISSEKCINNVDDNCKYTLLQCSGSVHSAPLYMCHKLQALADKILRYCFLFMIFFAAPNAEELVNSSSAAK